MIFKGEQRVKPEKLSNGNVHSQYKADNGKLHELERDVTKHWKRGIVEFSVLGLENQTVVDNFMPFRIFSYDGRDETEIKHVDAVLKLLSAMTGDARYANLLTNPNAKKGVHNMCDVAERVENKGRVEGRAEGRTEERMANIRNMLAQSCTT